jgi:hypothetical protein
MQVNVATARSKNVGAVLYVATIRGKNMQLYGDDHGQRREVM